MTFLRALIRSVVEFFWPPEPPHWEAIQVPEHEIWRVRWSEPTAGGLYLYVEHYSGGIAEHLATRRAAEWNEKGRRPWEFSQWRELTGGGK